MKNPRDTIAVKKVKKILLGRILVVGFATLFQFAWLFFFIYQFSIQYSVFDIVFRMIGTIVVLRIINGWMNPAYKIVWTVLILSFPLAGIIIYALFGRSVLTKHTREELERVHREIIKYLPRNYDLEKELYKQSKSGANQSKYISCWSDFPLYTNTSAKYYSCGENMFPDILKDLEQAEHFIFLEYFIIADGVLFRQILEILQRKVKAGVDVRIIYDDFGCITTLPYNFSEKMQSLGIKCVSFNPMKPIVSILMNNRDHRKILVTDGIVAYTGGLNLADEYINEEERFGYWKDTGVRLEGEAVWSFTAMFLEMWNFIHKTTENYQEYFPQKYQKHPFEADGYIQPYGDSPLDTEKVGENVYMNMIAHANEYVYIFTPYLILDNEMLTYLRNAAKSGVDIRIVTPDIPDKKLVFWMSQSYYQRLLECGVRIYQYTPGFIHAKIFVCDDKIATVGSINMDFRSLYLHFECGVWMYQNSIVEKIKEDALKTIGESKEITLEFCKKQRCLKKVLLSVLRLIAPLV